MLSASSPSKGKSDFEYSTQVTSLAAIVEIRYSGTSNAYKTKSFGCQNSDARLYLTPLDLGAAYNIRKDDKKRR
jgi:hypothetical protein